MTTSKKSQRIRQLLKKVYDTIQFSKTTSDIGQRFYLISHCFRIVSQVICWGTNLPLNQFNVIAQQLANSKLDVDEMTEILENYVLFFTYELVYTKGS